MAVPLTARPDVVIVTVTVTCLPSIDTRTTLPVSPFADSADAAVDRAGGDGPVLVDDDPAGRPAGIAVDLLGTGARRLERHGRRLRAVVQRAVDGT